MFHTAVFFVCLVCVAGDHLVVPAPDQAQLIVQVILDIVVVGRVVCQHPWGTFVQLYIQVYDLYGKSVHLFRSVVLKPLCRAFLAYVFTSM